MKILEYIILINSHNYKKYSEIFLNKKHSK